MHFQDFVCLLVRAREFAIRTASRTIQSKIVCQLVDVAKCRLVMTKYVAIRRSGIVQLVAGGEGGQICPQAICYFLKLLNEVTGSKMGSQSLGS